MKITVLSGGHGGAKFIQGLLHMLRSDAERSGETAAEVSVIANTADDLWLHGLKICPDLDTVMYTLGEGLDHDRGWGRVEETWSIAEELNRYGVEGTWFGLGDRDIATHLVRTQMLDAGYSLTEVTDALCRRWNPGVRLLPMTDDRVETHVAVADPDSPSGRTVVHFQEYWVRMHAAVPAEALVFVGLDQAEPAPEVVETILDADLVIVPPSNPVVSVGTILGVRGVRDALGRTKAPVVGVSPIIGGHHVRGMAEQVLASIGVAADAGAVGMHYGPRSQGGILDGWLVDTTDADSVPLLAASGIRCAAVPLWMHTEEATADIARAAIELVS
ncbi:MAG: 2-phospho-L-lactate transferase [Nocardioides sp.]